MASTAAVVDGLRRWARGSYAEEAAVELLVRSFGGRFTAASCEWVRACDAPGWFWLDGEPLRYATGHLSAGERRVLALVGALTSGSVLVDLADILSGLDRPHLALVLAALAHAGGSHEHSDVTVDGERMVFRRLPALIEWPSARIELAS